jgi:hypothetical protein
MHNVAPSRSLARQSRHLLTIAFVVAAIGVFIGVAGLALFVIQLVSPQSQYYSLFTFMRSLIILIGIVIFVIGVGVGVRAVTLKKDNDDAMVTGRFLARYLDERYHFIRNINQRGLGYIDAVLVGPPGVLVFRILNKSGIYMNEGANWLKKTSQSSDWAVADIKPTVEAVQDIQKVREHLSANKLGDVPVYGVIIFNREEPQLRLTLNNPVVPVTTLANAVTTLGSNYLAKDQRIDAAKVAAVVRNLYNG